MHEKKGRHYYCKNCLSSFARFETMIEHKNICIYNKPQKVTMPKESQYIKFSNLTKTVWHPYVIFADFESLTKKIHTVAPSPSTSYTIPIERHEPISYSIVVLDNNSKIIFHEFHFGNNVIETFLNTLKEISTIIFKKMTKISPMTEDPDREIDPSICHICKSSFKKNRY